MIGRIRIFEMLVQQQTFIIPDIYIVTFFNILAHFVSKSSRNINDEEASKILYCHEVLFIIKKNSLKLSGFKFKEINEIFCKLNACNLFHFP